MVRNINICLLTVVLILLSGFSNQQSATLIHTYMKPSGTNFADLYTFANWPHLYWLDTTGSGVTPKRLSMMSTNGFFHDTVSPSNLPLGVVPPATTFLREALRMCQLREDVLVMVGYPKLGTYADTSRGTIVIWNYNGDLTSTPTEIKPE